MVHRAYDSVELLHGFPSKIESVASYGSKLLVGCMDGCLRIYSSESWDSKVSSSPGVIREPYFLENAVGGFSRKPITSIEVSASRNLLISLSDSICFHQLPNLETISIIQKSKGANLYVWDDRKGVLCFAKQKRVVFLRIEGNQEFVEVKEFSVPDLVKSMAWCGENICVGIRREYVILNSINGSLCEIFPSGRIASPLVVLLSSGELLLGKDNIGVFVDQDGKLLQDGRICWSEAPSSVVIHMAYAIARLSKHIEIRSLRAPYSLVQAVTLRDVRQLVQSNDRVFTIFEDSIHELLSVPYGAQIVQLTASGNFEEALTLCKLLPPEDSTLRASKEDSIHIRYGQYLFQSGTYEEAMEQFLASSIGIKYVICLYPSLVLPKIISLSEPERLDLVDDPCCLTKVPSDASDETASSSSQEYERSSVEIKKMSHNAFAALVKFLKKRRFSIIKRATAEATEQAVSEAVKPIGLDVENIASKSHGHISVSSSAREAASLLDTALLQAFLLTGQSQAVLELLRSPNYCDAKICGEFLKQRHEYTALLELYNHNEMHREALDLLRQLVEESCMDDQDISGGDKFHSKAMVEYLKSLCNTDPVLVLEFSVHALDSYPDETVELLVSGDLPPDLVNSYLKQKAPKMQVTYLELMLAKNRSGISPSLQSELVDVYLSEVIQWYKDLKNQNKWDENEFSEARKKLLIVLEGGSSSNAEILLTRLPSDALYEEHALLYGNLNQHEQALFIYALKLHKHDRALAYCDRIYESGLNHHSKLHSNIYHALLQIYANPKMAMKRSELRVGNTGSHWSSLSDNQRKGVQRIKGHRSLKKIAEIEWADNVQVSTSSTDSGRSDGDTDEPGGDDTPAMLEKALDMLNQRWERINGAHAIKLLPRETKLHKLLCFLEPLLKKLGESRRNFSVVRSLRYKENLQVREEFCTKRKSVVKITGDSMCSLCNKRIGGSVFVVYPNGKTLVHFVCFRNSQNINVMLRTPPRKTS